jgi:hypothetical protein
LLEDPGILLLGYHDLSRLLRPDKPVEPLDPLNDDLRVLGRLSYDRRNPGNLVPVAGFVVSRER